MSREKNKTGKYWKNMCFVSVQKRKYYTVFSIIIPKKLMSSGNILIGIRG